MIHYKNLTKLFIRSLRLNKANTKGGKVFFHTLMFISIVFIFIPFLLIFSTFIYDMMSKLQEVGFASTGFEVILGLMMIFIFIFSFNVVLNELYFSDDIENLLPLPIKPEIMVASKFTSCFLIENFVLFLLLFFACLSYILAINGSFINLLLSAVGVILIPLIPMIYGVLISMIFLYILRSIINKKVMRRIGFIFLLVLVVGIYFLLKQLSIFNFESYVEQFAEGNHQFLHTVRFLFPSLPFFVKGLTEGSILSILLSLVVQGIYIVILLCFAKLFYVDGVLAITSKDTDTRRSSVEIIKNNRVKTPIKSYFEKELKVLFRSPTFFINCILINIIWPVFAYLIFKIGLPKYSISKMQELIAIKDTQLFFILFLMILGISIIIPAFNSIASSSFSREGKNYHFIKYIPLKYGVQWRIKLMTSIVISFIGINFFATIFYGSIHLPILYWILFYIISLLCILLVSFIGILIDTSYPKIVWDDEADALRENYNAFIAMGFSLLVFGLLCGGTYYLFQYQNVSLPTLLFGNLSFLILGNILFYSICNKNLSHLIIYQEV